MTCLDTVLYYNVHTDCGTLRRQYINAKVRSQSREKCYALFFAYGNTCCGRYLEYRCGPLQGGCVSTV